MIEISSDDEKPKNDLIRAVLFLVIAMVGIWSLMGWWLVEGPLAYRLLMAGITVGFELWCMNVSAQKARADTRSTGWAVRTYWVLALMMCGGWSMFSAHHAIELFTPEMTDQERLPAQVVLLMAAFLLPLAPWAIERTENAPLLDRSLSDRRAEPPRRSPLRAVGKVALAASVATTPVVAAATPMDGPPAAQFDALDGAWRARARELWMAGERNKAAIARAVGRPRETVRRELSRIGV